MQIMKPVQIFPFQSTTITLRLTTLLKLVMPWSILSWLEGVQMPQQLHKSKLLQ